MLRVICPKAKFVLLICHLMRASHLCKINLFSDCRPCSKNELLDSYCSMDFGEF